MTIQATINKTASIFLKDINITIVKIIPFKIKYSSIIKLLKCIFFQHIYKKKKIIIDLMPCESIAWNLNEIDPKSIKSIFLPRPTHTRWRSGNRESWENSRWAVNVSGLSGWLLRDNNIAFIKVPCSAVRQPELCARNLSLTEQTVNVATKLILSRGE